MYIKSTSTLKTSCCFTYDHEVNDLHIMVLRIENTNHATTCCGYIHTVIYIVMDSTCTICKQMKLQNCYNIAKCKELYSIIMLSKYQANPCCKHS